MKYLSHLPQERHLIDLARHAQFPLNRDELMLLACKNRYSPSTVRFFRLFDSSDVFESGVDLINRCEEMKLLIHDARLAQPELISSPEC